MKKILPLVTMLCLINCDAVRGITVYSATPYEGVPGLPGAYVEIMQNPRVIAGQAIITTAVHNPEAIAITVEVGCNWLIGNQVQFRIRKTIVVAARSSRKVDFASMLEEGLGVRCFGKNMATRSSPIWLQIMIPQPPGMPKQEKEK